MIFKLCKTIGFRESPGAIMQVSKGSNSPGHPYPQLLPEQFCFDLVMYSGYVRMVSGPKKCFFLFVCLFLWKPTKYLSALFHKENK